MDVGTRHHYFAHLNLVQLHGCLNKFHFGRRQQAAILGLLDHHLQFFGGTYQRVTVRRHDAQRANYFFSEAVQQIDGPAKRVKKPMEWPSDNQCNAFGAREA